MNKRKERTNKTKISRKILEDQDRNKWNRDWENNIFKNQLNLNADTFKR